MRWSESSTPQPKPSILEAFELYYPEVEVPEWGGPWKKILCPIHAEDRPSATINPEVGYWKCHACDLSEDAYAVVMREEGVSFLEAKARADAWECGSSGDVQPSVPREPSRRVPERPRFGRGGSNVAPRFRRRFGDGGS
ncbi:DNA primase [Streptomyces phage Ibantik]|uniref:DNA primase n=1 Tax=Streptomyces phage Ibantik TaxID=2182397 RepID=A0A2U8UP52_9CAUD|nr:DNA primase [Streptomyces phage Ibantik]AWN05261.1 DNA primase [Streptomyces phage Ibantik]